MVASRDYFADLSKYEPFLTVETFNRGTKASIRPVRSSASSSELRGSHQKAYSAISHEDVLLSSSPSRGDSSSMSSMSREEIDAKLGQSKAEAEATAALVRAEIASFREFQAQQFATMNTSLGEIKGSISASNGEIAGLKGHIDGLKTSVSTTQWLVGAILAILAIILAIPQVQVYFKPTEKVEVSSQVKPAAQEQPSSTGRDNSSQK